MAQTAFKPRTIEEGFEAVSGLIYAQVHRLIREHGGEFDELIGDAYERFLKGHKVYMDGKTVGGKPVPASVPYSAVIRKWVWYGLYDDLRMRCRRHRIAPMETQEDFDPVAVVPDPLFVPELMEELGEDGRFVARLCLDLPDALYDAAMARGGAPRNIRGTVREFLRGGGWERDRINAAFADVARALG